LHAQFAVGVLQFEQRSIVGDGDDHAVAVHVAYRGLSSCAAGDEGREVYFLLRTVCRALGGKTENLHFLAELEVVLDVLVGSTKHFQSQLVQ
jgi:hypothetical protein